MNALYEMGVYRYNYRNGDYTTVTVGSNTFVAPVANVLLVLQYAAAANSFTGHVTLDNPEYKISFHEGEPVNLTGEGGKYIYGQDEILARIRARV